MGTISLSWSKLWDQIVGSYRVDAKLQILCQKIQEHLELHPKYSWDGRMIRRLGKVVVGHNEQLNFFFQNHLSTRWGSNKTKSDPEGCIDKQGGISR
ncbi:hypothetical protein ES319_D05G403500v1 [Gossypium barbadense]|uniref:Uncharacterized protein n=1 Tax=Gossypium barbadense TaxID=3634 RepID=A0A5J5RR60_GOSBA|nr:hypothetical protein ES319_D05G403500v1 [Gossypium barbadense]